MKNNYSIFGLSPMLSYALTFVLAALAATVLFHAPEFALIGPAAAMTLDDLQVELKTAADELKSEASNLRDAQKELKERYGKDGALPDNVKAAIDGVLTNFHELKAKNDDLEQRIAARIAGNEQKNALTWGEQVSASPEFKERGQRMSTSKGSFALEMKTVNTAAVAGMIRSQREQGIVSMGREGFVMRDLIPVIPTDTNAIDYVRQITRTNNAGPVAEGAAASYSDFAWENDTANVRRLAHLAKMSRQALTDARRLSGEINSEMRYGLGYKEERQFLYGSGVGENLNGIITQATAFARPAGVGQMANVNRLDSLRIVVLQAALTLFPADGIVINPLDWAMIELLKDGNGNYLIGNPNGASPEKRLWSLRVVDTPAMDAGDYLVGNFAMGATIYDREQTSIEISTENADDFEKNMATMSAAERLALAVKRPDIFISDTFANTETELEAA